jgi:methyl-accepting chemotaxis protein
VVIVEVLTEETQEKIKRWRQMLGLINRIQAGLTAITCLFWLLILFTTQKDSFLKLLILTFVMLLVTLASLLMLISHKNSWLYLSTAISIGGYLITVSYGNLLVGANSGVEAAIFWAPVYTSILGLPNMVLGIVIFFSMLALSLTIILHSTGVVVPLINLAADMPYANVLFWCMCLLIVMAGIFVFKSRLEKSLIERSRTNRQIFELNRQLQEAAIAGKDLSQRVNSMSLELQASSQQQATGAAEQSSAVVAITTSLEEMVLSGNQIAQNSSMVYQTASSSLQVAQQVKAVSQEADIAARRGQDSVEASIQNFEKIQNRIEELAQRLLMLTESSKKIGNVIDLIASFSDETHLLALNAAIESAGAGNYGTRFAVIATEVKNLADRSIESTREVRQIISELQGAIAGAVLAAEESKKETVKAVIRSHETGDTIKEVSRIITQTASQGAEIVEYVETVSRLSEEISLSMQQQQTVSSQLINSLQGIKSVAQESAVSSKQVAQSASQLSDMIFQLQNLLNIKDESPEKVVA